MRHILKTAVPLLAVLLMMSQASADIINFKFFGRGGDGLLTSNETTPPSTGGSGDATSLFYDTDTDILTIVAVWGSGNGFDDMTGTVTGIHLHGPADIDSNAGVVVNLTGDSGFNNSATDGGLNTTVSLSAANETSLLNGLLYLNVHTSANGSGEIRGNLIAVPEPASALLGFGSLAAMALIRRRR